MSDLTLLSEWEDEPEEGCSADDWPYPTRHLLSVASGELADRIRRALGVADATAEVTVEEVVTSGGWSEYTQEDDYEMVLRCGDASTTVQLWTGELPELLRWLDENAPIDDTSPSPAPFGSPQEGPQ